MKYLCTLFVSFLFVTFSNVALACGNGGNTPSFYSRTLPHLEETSLRVFYVRFGGGLENLNRAISGQKIVTDSISRKERVFSSLAAATEGTRTSYVLGFSKAERTLISVHDAQTGEELMISIPKGCGDMFVTAK